MKEEVRFNGSYLHTEKSVNSDPNLSDHPLSCWDVCVCVNDRYIKPYSTDDHQSVYINRGGWCIMALQSSMLPQ